MKWWSKVSILERKREAVEMLREVGAKSTCAVHVGMRSFHVQEELKKQSGRTWHY